MRTRGRSPIRRSTAPLLRCVDGEAVVGQVGIARGTSSFISRVFIAIPYDNLTLCPVSTQEFHPTHPPAQQRDDRIRLSDVTGAGLGSCARLHLSDLPHPLRTCLFHSRPLTRSSERKERHHPIVGSEKRHACRIWRAGPRPETSDVGAVARQSRPHLLLTGRRSAGNPV